MEKVFVLEIVTPYGLVVNAEVREVYIPGSQGDLDVLPGHAPLMTTLRTGGLHYRQGKEVHFVAVNRGFAEVTATKTTILTDTAESADAIDVERAQKAKSRAEERLGTTRRSDPSYNEGLEALERAEARLRVAAKGRS